MEEGTVKRQMNWTRLWLPALLIIISIILALIQLANLILHHPYYLNPYNSTMITSALYAMVLPLLVLGIALLLLLLTKARKGFATWSRLLFCVGAILLIISGVLLALYDWGFYLLVQEQPRAPIWFSESFVYYGQMTAALGLAICALASLLIVRAYLNGDISVKHPEVS